MKPTQQIAAPLLAWYDSGRRILPWRELPTPYRVWISEIMLQQTRVEAVKPFFERFMQAFPDIASLAGAGEDKLLKMWEGLGYYNRVRNLQKAAIIIMDKYQGELPETTEELMKLPGIGSYTAGAISSIAYHHTAAAVDGNVLRVIARVTADNSDIAEPKVKKELEKSLLAVIPPERPGDFNQALMELGATVCIPKGIPKCEACPWTGFCEARKQERIEQLPRKAAKKVRVIEQKTILVVRDENSAAIRKRPAKGLLAGMYEFPTMEGHRSADEVLIYLQELGVKPVRIQRLENSKHIFTHKEWHMIGYAIRVDEIERMPETPVRESFLLVGPKETEEKYPIPAAFGAYTRYLNIRLGNEKFE